MAQLGMPIVLKDVHGQLCAVKQFELREQMVPRQYSMLHTKVNTILGP